MSTAMILPRNFKARRHPLVAAGLLLSLALPCGGQTASTPDRSARTVIARIVAANGAVAVPNTVDTIKAGDPNTTVTGIVTTFMDTYDVLQKAVAAGDNLIITHEPTFYNHIDDRSILPADPVVAAKLAYIEAHHLVVWRFHDGWHDHQPDGILEGEVAALGWNSYRVAATTDNPSLFRIPCTTVADLATHLQQKLGSSVVRVVGDPETAITDVALLPGAAGLVEQVKTLERNDVQVLVAGESAEWEAVEYVRDAAAIARAGNGKPKALILLGHEPSEEAGMRYCATWLQTVLPGTRIDFIPAGSPFSLVTTSPR